MADPLPPLPADDGSCRIEVFGPPVTYIDEGFNWDQSNWDTAKWSGYEGGGSGLAWRDVTPQSMNAQISWGAEDPAGILSVAAAGSWLIRTYDPDRLLDPSNPSSPLAAWLVPGGFCRIMFKNEIVRHGFLDEVAYDIATGTGNIRASDGISLMVKAKVPEGLAHSPDAPLTMRAFARWILQQAQVKYIQVEDDPAGEPDPPCGPPLDTETGAWQQINAAALDAFCAVWLDRFGILRFQSFLNPRPLSPLIIGGSAGVPIDTIEAKISLENVYNHIRAANDQWINPAYGDAKNQDAIDLYGDLLLTRERNNPDAGEWAKLVLKDRGQSEARLGIGTMRFQTDAQLIQALDLGMGEEVQVRQNARPPGFSVPVTVLGGRIEANTVTGWTGGLVTYQPSSPLNREAKPLYTARFDVTKNRQLYVLKGNTGGGETPTPFDLRVRNNDDPPGSKTTRLLFDCDPIDWTGITKIIKAYFCFFNPPHDHSTTDETDDLRYIQVNEVTAAWDENAVWPGPAVAEDFWAEIDSHIGWEQERVTNIMTRWMNGTTQQHGIAVDVYHMGYPLQDAWAATEDHVQFNNKTVGSRPFFMMYYER